MNSPLVATVYERLWRPVAFYVASGVTTGAEQRRAAEALSLPGASRLARYRLWPRQFHRQVGRAATVGRPRGRVGHLGADADPRRAGQQRTAHLLCPRRRGNAAVRRRNLRRRLLFRRAVPDARTVPGRPRNGAGAAARRPGGDSDQLRESHPARPLRDRGERRRRSGCACSTAMRSSTCSPSPGWSTSSSRSSATCNSSPPASPADDQAIE